MMERPVLNNLILVSPLPTGERVRERGRRVSFTPSLALPLEGEGTP